ncbi:30S ribosomal protein S7 [Candidatus Falkowbacteria bacterium]|uniref:Small ribosomal subunit protein uS7 n=1 Tax=Candidatus Buchananbacteria bacterium CG10_big_fil_rev_8_21_14_0_10_33_19 TaxID=1974525 RepID=A0A2H0W2Y3_9BACT|nr:30S ribosomal protein S7 [Candidatus Falkowbacteria bacterium]PIS05719.1 MAG: 30S ribosomal protein S7 [Candidatus Buchananbacteria bacterium CG10_big_fil_rev_8_21_14_0_10_33_19]
MRGKQAPKRPIAPDTKFNRTDLAKFINYIMQRGKKTIAEDIVYEMMQIISDKTQLDPVEVFESAIRNVSPTVEIKGRRVGGANYQVPMAVRSERSFTLACRWLITASAAKKGKKMSEKLAEEFIAAHNNEGIAVKKKQDTYKMAEANRAFAHFGRN